MSDLKGVEALRGLAAIGIATYSWLWAVGMTASPPAANLYLLYDLFFVISGFVIAQVYRARLTSGQEVARFALLRLGRVYPLHLAVLLLLLAVQTLSNSGGLNADDGTLRSFLANLAMLQGLGVVEPGVWNAPAWFISVEFALSILFALLCVADIPRSGVGLGAIALCVFWAIWMMAGRSDGLPAEDGGLLARGFASFMLGVLAQAVRRANWWVRANNELGIVGGTLRELALAAAAIAALVFAPPEWHAVAPGISAAFVLAISGGRGAISWILARAPLQALARISFGVFMCHWLLAAPMREAVINQSDQSLDALGRYGATLQDLAVIATPIYLFAVILLAVVAERWVERPTRQAMRAWIDRRSRGYARAARRQSDVV